MPLQSPSINCGCGVPRDKDKNLGSVGKCDRMQRYIRQDIIWNVVDENEKKRQTAKKVESQIAPAPLIEIGIGGAVPRAVLASMLGQLPGFTHGMQRAPFRRGWLSWSIPPLEKTARYRRGARAVWLRAKNAIAVRRASPKSDRGSACARTPSSPTVNRYVS
jgi:hypothetical protein